MAQVRSLAKSQFAFALTFSRIDDELVARARDGDVVIITSKENNKLQAIVKLNGFVDAYLLAGRFIDADVLAALNQTRVAADDYQSLSLRQFDLQISLAVMFAVVALMLLLASIWVGLNLATSIAGPLVSVITVAEQVRSGNFKERFLKVRMWTKFHVWGPVSTECLMMCPAAVSSWYRQTGSWMPSVNLQKLFWGGIFWGYWLGQGRQDHAAEPGGL